MGLNAKKPVFQVCEQQRPADQPVHPRRLISAFVICYLESIISNLLQAKFQFFLLISVAEETGLNLLSSETPNTGFFMARPLLQNITDA